MPDNPDEQDAALQRIEQAAEDVRLQIAHAHAQLYDRKRRQEEARRQYARDYYARNRERLLEDQRRYRQTRQEQDPERYAQLRRARNQRWYDRHREQENAKQREKYRHNPDAAKQRRAQYYAEHADEIKAARRARWAKNKEKETARQARWRDREKRRREVGLPARRLHKVDREQIDTHTADADAFFARRWTRAEVRRMSLDFPTPPHLIAAWERESARARAAHHLSEQSEELTRLQRELGRARPGPTPREIERARQEEIGRQINERLRYREPPRSPHHLDPAAPHPMLNPNTTMGMNR